MGYIIKITTKKVGWLWDRKTKVSYTVGWEEPTHFCDSGYVTVGYFKKIEEFDSLKDADEFLRKLIGETK